MARWHAMDHQNVDYYCSIRHKLHADYSYNVWRVSVCKEEVEGR